MLTLEQALRRSVATLGTLGLIAATGTASAQGSPTTGDEETTSPDMTDETTSPEQTTAPEPMVEEEVDVVTPEEPAPATTYTTPVYVEPVEETEQSTLERYGVAVTLGGGVAGFTGDTMRDTTDVGGIWNVRAAFGTRSPIGFEAAYIGSAQGINALGLDSDAILVGNGAEGNLRVNFLDANIQPFAIAGVAWRHYNLTNEDFNTSDIDDSDDVFEVPLGVGLAWKYEGFTLDARGVFRYTAGEDMVPSLNGGDNASMHRWGVNANLGYAF